MFRKLLRKAHMYACTHTHTCMLTYRHTQSHRSSYLTFFRLRRRCSDRSSSACFRSILDCKPFWSWRHDPKKHVRQVVPSQQYIRYSMENTHYSKAQPRSKCSYLLQTADGALHSLQCLRGGVDLFANCALYCVMRLVVIQVERQRVQKSQGAIAGFLQRKTNKLKRSGWRKSKAHRRKIARSNNHVFLGSAHILGPGRQACVTYSHFLLLSQQSVQSRATLHQICRHLSNTLQLVQLACKWHVGKSLCCRRHGRINAISTVQR